MIQSAPRRLGAMRAVPSRWLGALSPLGAGDCESSAPLLRLALSLSAP